LRWPHLRFSDEGVAGNLRELVSDPLSALTAVTIDARAIFCGLLDPRARGRGSGAQRSADRWRGR
jgi:hypothetical protein